MINKILFVLLIVTVVVLGALVFNSYDTASMRHQKQIAANQRTADQRTQAEKSKAIAEQMERDRLEKQCLIGLDAYNHLTDFQKKDLKAPECMPGETLAP